MALKPGDRSGISAEDFIELFETVGPTGIAEMYGITQRGIYRRRRSIENDIGRTLTPPKQNREIAPAGRVIQNIANGHIIVFSDCHYWPDEITVMHRGVVKLCEMLKPQIVVANGDIFDFPSISRFGPDAEWGWRPTIKQEIETCQARLEEIRAASPKARHFYTRGNHDARFTMHLAKGAPEMHQMHGFHIADYVKPWEYCLSIWVNNIVQIKHRWRGGMHAVFNNIRAAHMSMVTSHTHCAKIVPYTNAHEQTLWGVDTGMIADPYARAFEYAEDNPRDWRQGCAVLTFANGRMLQPQLALPHDANSIEFRNEVIKI